MRDLLKLSVFLVSLCLFAAPVSAQQAPPSFADLAAELLPMVVNISSTQKVQPGVDEYPEMPEFPPGSPFEDFFNEFMDQHGRGVPAVPPASLGSGFIVDAAQGLIVTNNHVVKDADEVRVTFSDDDTIHAEVIGRDEKTDLAVLKVVTKKELHAVKWGTSDDLRVGDWVLAIGNPFGLGGTVTAGIVSAQKRNINAGPYDSFIQTDASINRGNSGGPMFNIRGELIGINTAIFSPSGGSVGIGFAIPSSLAKPVVDQIVQFGHTRRGWLGVRIQTVTEDIAESFGIEGKNGALVASVTPEGPAEKAGLKAGDIITEFDGKKITEMRNLPRIVAETPIDTEAELTYWRDGKSQTAKVKVGELEKAEEDGRLSPDEGGAARKPGDGVKVESVGLTLAEIGPQDREEFKIPAELEGVLVSDVANMSEAAEKGLLPGDVVVEINQQPVKAAKDAADMIAGAEKSGRTSVLMLVNREGDVRFVALRLKKE